MEITMNRNSAHVFSPFGRRERAFQDSGLDGSDMRITRGTTLPELARLYYGINQVAPFQGNFSFLDRDNKERSYSPGTEDPFVFHSGASLKLFNEEALRLIGLLTSYWKRMGLPTKKDDKRGVEVIDTSVVWESLPASSKNHNVIKRYKAEILFITSNMDIILKACVVRGIIPGWWASSYAGKYAPNMQHFEVPLRALDKALRVLGNTEAYRKIRNETMADLGDPLDTNVGWPFFSASVNADGDPVTRLRLLETFKDLGTMGNNWKKVMLGADARARSLGMHGYPFAIAPIRRLQPGYKWLHVFNQTSMGLTASHDEQGNNSIRIAWMASYLLNLYLSPLQLDWKVARKLLPGSFHDGSAKFQRLKQLRQSNPWLAEADYSNYDRFMPINLFLTFVKKYLNGKPHSDYWLSMCYALHHQIPIIWPDYIGSERGKGWIFTPSRIGLLSGLKITSEEGTFINLLVNLAALHEIGALNESSMVDYLVQYRNGNVGTGREFFHIQSDDLLLIADTPDFLYKYGNAFKNATDAAGLKGSLEFGDRFLMRHNNNGRDTPVPARVWQNTLSNEEPYDDELKFLVGLAMRTDGLLGHKTVDPFNTGKLLPVTPVELDYTLESLRSIQKFLTTAARRQTQAIAFLNQMITAAQSMKARVSSNSPVTMGHEDANTLDKMRKHYLELLAQREIAAIMDSHDPLNKKSMATLLYQLHKQSNVPSQKMLLDQILALGDFGPALQRIANKENAFYQYAMKTINVPIQL